MPKALQESSFPVADTKRALSRDGFNKVLSALGHPWRRNHVQSSSQDKGTRQPKVSLCIGSQENGHESEHRQKAATTVEDICCTNPKCTSQRKELMARVTQLESQLRVMSAEQTPPRYVNATEPSTPPSHKVEANSEIQGSEGQRSDKLPLPPFFSASIPYGRIAPDLLITDADLKFEALIGTGSFGKVYKGFYRSSAVAVKCFLSESFDVVEEIEVMQRVTGKPHILNLCGVYLSRLSDESAYVALVTPFMKYGSLYDLLINQESPNYRAEGLPVTVLVKMAMQAAEGVRSLHQENVIHRDLACRNLLVDENFDIMVSDFGFARQKQENTTKGFTDCRIGPVKWEAPESLQHKEYSEKTDAYMFGVCLYEMVTRSEPWESYSSWEVAVKVLSGERLRIPVDCDPVLGHVMTLCSQADPNERPNFDDIFRLLRERYLGLQQEEKQVDYEKRLIQVLRKGTILKKLPFDGGHAHQRHFYISGDFRRLKWQFVPSKSMRQRAMDPVRPILKHIMISDIVELRQGLMTENFRRPEVKNEYKDSFAFSIMTKARSLDFICPSAEVMDIWLSGLRFLMNRLEKGMSSLHRKISTRLSIELQETTDSLEVKWAMLARLRRGGFLLKFARAGNQSANPHERFFRVSDDTKYLTWISGDNLTKKTVDLAAVKEVRLVTDKSLHWFHLARMVDHAEYSFSLIGSNGVTLINLCAPNEQTFRVWVKGLTAIVDNYRMQKTSTREEEKISALIHEEPKVANIYDNGFYLTFECPEGKEKNQPVKGGGATKGEQESSLVERIAEEKRSHKSSIHEGLLSINRTPSFKDSEDEHMSRCSEMSVFAQAQEQSNHTGRTINQEAEDASSERDSWLREGQAHPEVKQEGQATNENLKDMSARCLENCKSCSDGRYASADVLINTCCCRNDFPPDHLIETNKI